MSLAAKWGVTRSLIIYYGQPWKTARMRRFYAQFVSAGDLCVTSVRTSAIGFVLACAGAHAVAVEPQPRMVKTLERFFGSDPQSPSCRLDSRTDRAAHLHVNTRNPTITSFSPTAEAFSRMESAPFDEDVAVNTTLDELIAQHGVPAFCKIDVEGFEDKVMAGLSTPIPVLSFEAFPLEVERSLACVDKLMTLGTYRFRTVLAEQFRWVEPEWMDADAVRARLNAWTMQEGSGDVTSASSM